MARIYDNIDINFNEGLNNILKDKNVRRVDFCVGYFNLRGWNLVEQQIDELPGDYVEELDQRGQYTEKKRYCRLLIGMHRPDKELVRALYSRKTNRADADYVQKSLRKIAEEFRNQLLLGRPTEEAEQTLRHLSQQMKDGKVCVKLYLSYPLHAKLYIAHQPGCYTKKIALMGSSNLTYSGLRGNGELNADFADSDHTEKLARWFDDRWNDRMCIDITDQLIEIIDNSWAGLKNIPPYYIYLKTAYHLSQDARNGIREFDLPKEFQIELFEFQQNAVKIAARNLTNERRNGAMIGDVVGLGKTITACAIAKIFENTLGATTLIICPASLQDMWHKYINKYNLKAYVHSMQKPIDVENARRYKLIIIDESHNLRNSGGVRYQNIQSLIEKQEAKVLLLTATPYNKDFSDLSSQLELFIPEDMDLGIRPENYIQEIGGDFEFARKHADVDMRTIAAFKKSDNADDWNELMRLFLVRRTRSFIKQNYAKEDPVSKRRYLTMPDGSRNYFPDRIPKSETFETQPGDQYSRLYSEEMINLMDELLLPRYGLSLYYDAKHDPELKKCEKDIIENLSRAGARMMGFAKSTFFKRIDSSGYSFLLTLCRHALRNAMFIYAIDNKLPLPIRDTNPISDGFSDQDENDGEEALIQIKDGKLCICTDFDTYIKKGKEYYEAVRAKGNCVPISSTYFKRTLKQNLKADIHKIIEMIDLCGDWNPETDQKLNKLQELIEQTHFADKALVFTQYSDTAEYIAEELKRRGVKAVDVATGDSKNQTQIVEKFSPVSNEASIPPENETRILVSTDVLSEGQNLQDSHIIINYDLPWAIIRLIQRAGRVDRIGQQSEKIYCYSFFPAEGVEKIINLRKRLNERINENAHVLGSDEVFFEGNEQNLRDMFNEKSGVLDDDDTDDVDLSSFAYQIWKNAIDKDPKLATIIPALSNQIYATKATESDDKSGVVTYAKTYNDFDVLTWLSPEGKVISQSQKRILQAMACDESTPAAEGYPNHLELVGQAIDQMEQETRTINGTLGNRFSTRYRISMMLNDYLDNNKEENLFFAEEQQEQLKLAIDEIFQHPLLASARITLGRMMSQRRSSEEIVDYVIEMRKAGTLCNIPPEEMRDNREPQIVCSMGMRPKNEKR